MTIDLLRGLGALLCGNPSSYSTPDSAAKLFFLLFPELLSHFVTFIIVILFVSFSPVIRLFDYLPDSISGRFQSDSAGLLLLLLSLISPP